MRSLDDGDDDDDDDANLEDVLQAQRLAPPGLLAHLVVQASFSLWYLKNTIILKISAQEFLTSYSSGHAPPSSAV